MSSNTSADPEEANSHALSTVTAQFTLHLHPSRTQDVMEGVREQLNLGLLRHSDDLGGIMLAYSGEALAAPAGRLHPYFPFLRVAATARVTLFAPAPGQRLVGRVVKVGADYIGLLVLGVFNAAVGAGRIRREFRCPPGAQAWTSLKDASHAIRCGDLVRFSVDGVADHGGGAVTISGALLEPGTGRVGHPSVGAAAAAAAAAGPSDGGGGGKAKPANGKVQQQQQQQPSERRQGEENGDKAAAKSKKRKDKEGGGGGTADRSPEPEPKKSKKQKDKGKKKDKH